MKIWHSMRTVSAGTVIRGLRSGEDVVSLRFQFCNESPNRNEQTVMLTHFLSINKDLGLLCTVTHIQTAPDRLERY